MSWHIEGCAGACLACLIEETVLEHYGTQGLDFLRRKVGASETEHQWICPRCKVDRFKEDCKGDRMTCPMVGIAHNANVTGLAPGKDEQ